MDNTLEENSSQISQLEHEPLDLGAPVDAALTSPSDSSNEVDEAVAEPLPDVSAVPLPAAISAILFSTSRPITLQALLRLTDANEEQILDALAEVKGMFSGEIHGFTLNEVAGGYQFRTDATVAPILRRLLPTKTRRLSKAAAETLAVIAYKQPVQRAEIESIRGVDALPTIKTLLEQKLIRVIGHEGSIGQPSLYGTTEYFLERFGLRDLSALPTERELLVLEDEPGEHDAGKDEIVDEAETGAVEDLTALQ